MSFLDRYLAVWILVAMAVGLLLGRFVPGIADALDTVKVAGVSLPIAPATASSSGCPSRSTGSSGPR